MPYKFNVSDVTPGRNGGKRLAIIYTGADGGEVAEATGVEYRMADLGVIEGHIAMRDIDDNDVRDFLQGALDAAWKMGLRPSHDAISIADLISIAKDDGANVEKLMFYARPAEVA